MTGTRPINSSYSAGHRDNIHTVFLGIQEYLEGITLHLAGNGNDDLSYAFSLDDFKQMIVPGQNGKSIQTLANLGRVVIHEANQEKRLWLHFVINMYKRFPGAACADYQHPVQECLGRKNLDIDQAARSGSERMQKPGKRQSPGVAESLWAK